MPILIQGDAGFTAANGVTGGSGTAKDPYIIECWYIDSHTDRGILLQETTAWFVIRNVSVSNTTNDHKISPGIDCDHVSNGTIQNSTCFDCDTGIELNGSSNLTLSGNLLHNNYLGVNINNSRDISMTSSRIGNHNDEGILVYYSDNVSIHDNDIGNSTFNGIYSWQSARITVSNNSVHDSREGIGLHDVLNWSVSGNRVFNSSWCGIQEGWGFGDYSYFGTSPDHTENGTINNNTIYNNSYYGLWISANYTERVDIVGNEVYDNYPGGIYLGWPAENGTLSGNLVSNNHGNGVEFLGARNSTLIYNQVCNNTGSGIYIDRNRYYDPYFSTSPHNITLIGNQACNNSDCGILIIDSSDDTLQDNLACNNSDCGILINDSSDDALRDNLACNNSGHGIALEGTMNGTVEGNIACNNTLCGFFVGSLSEEFGAGSDSNRLSSNRADNNTRGFLLSGSYFGELTGNSAGGNREEGIWLNYASVAILAGNRLDGNFRFGVRAANSFGMELYDSSFTESGLFLEGCDPLFFATHIVVNNTVNGKPLYYNVGQDGFTVPPDAGQVVLVDCKNASIRGVNISRASAPVECFGSTNVTVNASRLGDSTYGIYALESSITVSNSTMLPVEAGSDFFIDGNSTLVSQNTTFNGSRVNITTPDGLLAVYWHLGLLVRDGATGMPIGNSTVSIERSAGGTVAAGLTDGSGRLPPTLVHAYNRTAAGFEQFNPYVVSASARHYRDSRSTPPIEVNSTFTYIFEMADIALPWSRLRPLPEYINSTQLLLNFSAGDNGSGLSHILLFYDHDGHMEVYEPSGGGRYFNSSPVLFTNFTTDGEYLFHSVACDRAMNMQPGPYETVGTVLDTLPPGFTVYPWDAAGDVSPDAEVLVNFTEPVNISSVEATVAPGDWKLDWSEGGSALRLFASRNLEYDGMYTVTIATGMDRAGNRLSPAVSSFNTTYAPDSTVPRVESVRPEPGGVLQPGPANVTITFSERMNWTTVAAALRVNGAPAPGGTGRDRNYTFSVLMEPETNCSLFLSTVAADRAGNRLASPFSWNYAGAPLTGSISGRVVDEEGAGISGVNVSVAGRGTVTDDSGGFNLSAIRPGVHDLTAGGQPEYARNTTLITLGAGQNLTVIIVLHRLPTGLRGLVVDENGRPLAGAQVEVFATGRRVNWSVTGSGGEFGFSLPPGKYTVRVSKHGFRTATLEDRVVSSGIVTDIGQVRLTPSLDLESVTWILLLMLVVMVVTAVILFRRRKRPVI